MTGLIYLMLGCLYFICIGIDIAIFFVEIRLILLWKNISCLVPFDQAGKPLIEALTRQASRLLKTKRSLSQRGKLIIILLAFALIRIVLVAIYRQWIWQ
jgi:hypothetical protein